MKKTIKEFILNQTAKIGAKTAILAAGAASWFEVYQPKEPNEIKSFKLKNK